jgi:hypothetical protein
MASCNKLGARVRQVSKPLSLIIADEYLLQGHTVSWHSLLELIRLCSYVFPRECTAGAGPSIMTPSAHDGW